MKTIKETEQLNKDYAEGYNLCRGNVDKLIDETFSDKTHYYGCIADYIEELRARLKK